MRHSRRFRDRRQNIDGTPRRLGFPLFKLERLNGFGEDFLVEHVQSIVEKLLAAARATNLPAGCFRDGFRGDDEDFFGGKPVGLADERGEFFAEMRVFVGGITAFSELHDDDEGLFFAPCDLGVREGRSGDGEGGDGALFDLRKGVTSVFDVLRVVVLAADDDEIFRSRADVKLVIVVSRKAKRVKVLNECVECECVICQCFYCITIIQLLWDM